MTICDRTDNVGVSFWPGAAFCPICWASDWAPSVASRRIVYRDRIRQNLRRVVTNRLRIALADAGSPKRGLFTAGIMSGGSNLVEIVALYREGDLCLQES